MNPLDQLLASGFGPQIGDDGNYESGATEIGAAQRRVIRPGVPGGITQNQGNVRRLFAGIPSTSVAAAASNDVACNIAEPFRPDRLMLSVVAQALLVTNLRIGTKSMNVSSNPISGNCFSEQAVNNDLSGYTAQPGVGMLLSVNNPGASAVVLTGGFFGWSLV